MSRARFWVGSFGAVSLAVGIACVGEDGGAAEVGASGGACYPNGTCNGGLVCAGGRCTTSDAEGGPPGAPPPPPGTSTPTPPPAPPGPSDAGFLQATCDGAVPPANGNHVQCSGSVYCEARAETCCMGAADGTCIANQFACESPAIAFQCATGSQCADPAPCCLDLGQLQEDQCPATAALLGAACSNQASCGASSFEGCDDEWQCSDGGVCEVIQIASPVARALGICRRP